MEEITFSTWINFSRIMLHDSDRSFSVLDENDFERISSLSWQQVVSNRDLKQNMTVSSTSLYRSSCLEKTLS